MAGTMRKTKIWFYELFEQKAANSLKFIFMDTQRLIAESEAEIDKWQALIENEKQFLAKLTVKAEDIARDRAQRASDEIAQYKQDIERARQMVDKYNQ
jgi:molecular chaperone GrpE (heat shock protein)